MKKFALSLAVTFCIALAGCTGNPVATAETPNQKAGALLGVWNIVLEDAVEILEDRSIPNSVAAPVNTARIAGTRVAQTLSGALVDYELEKALFDAGEGSVAKVDIAAANLERWFDRLQEIYVDLAVAVAAARGEPQTAIPMPDGNTLVVATD